MIVYYKHIYKITYYKNVLELEPSEKELCSLSFNESSYLRSLDLKYGMLLIEISKAKLDNEPRNINS